MLRTALISATFLVACATDPASQTAPGGGGKADGQEPSIAFAADFTDAVSGTLLAGSPVTIEYDLARVTSCRSSNGEGEAWGVTGWAQFDDGSTTSFSLSRIDSGRVVPVAAELELPASASHVALWFTATDVYGCVAYDSDEGANYGFDLDRRGLGAVLDFPADGTLSQSGPIHAGDEVVVHYDPSRLAQCAGSTGGNAAWGITGHWQVDGGEVHDVMVSRADGADLVAADPQIAVPRGHDLALWFEATNVWGCHAYDSAYGANYHAAIE
jgi:uncharacterized protein YraI